MTSTHQPPSPPPSPGGRGSKRLESPTFLLIPRVYPLPPGEGRVRACGSTACVALQRFGPSLRRVRLRSGTGVGESGCRRRLCPPHHLALDRGHDLLGGNLFNAGGVVVIELRMGGLERVEE